MLLDRSPFPVSERATLADLLTEAQTLRERLEWLELEAFRCEAELSTRNPSQVVALRSALGAVTASCGAGEALSFIASDLDELRP